MHRHDDCDVAIAAAAAAAECNVSIGFVIPEYKWTLKSPRSYRVTRKPH